MLVSIVCVTNRPSYINNLIENFSCQEFTDIQYIVVLNSSDFLESDKKKLFDIGAEIIEVPENYSLGYCLNMACLRARGDIICKFDDDDIYGNGYISEVYNLFQGNPEIDLIGKDSAYIYFQLEGDLWLRSRKKIDEKVVLFGATLSFRRSLMMIVSFRPISKGEDSWFIKDCLSLGRKAMNSSNRNFCVIRRSPESHTWKVENKLFKKESLFFLPEIIGNYRNSTDVRIKINKVS